MLPADKARIGSFSDRIQVDPRDFTSDHDELLKILRTELQAEGPTPLWNAVNVGITALLHQQGRRVVLVFTDGMDAPMNFSAQQQLAEGRDEARRGRGRDGLRDRTGRLGMPIGGRRTAAAARRRPAVRRRRRAAAAERRRGIVQPRSPTKGCRRSPRPPAAATSS